MISPVSSRTNGHSHLVFLSATRNSCAALLSFVSRIHPPWLFDRGSNPGVITIKPGCATRKLGGRASLGRLRELTVSWAVAAKPQVKKKATRYFDEIPAEQSGSHKCRPVKKVGTLRRVPRANGRTASHALGKVIDVGLVLTLADPQK